VILNLDGNNFSNQMKEKIKAREKSYQDQWIKCYVILH
jgi:hypothetical protein